MRKERPILFSTEMVKAILDGRKTQTRRVVKPQPPQGCEDNEPMTEFCDYDNKKGFQNIYATWETQLHPDGFHVVVSPYGKKGDVLWVRETWTPLDTKEEDSVETDEDGIPMDEYQVEFMYKDAERKWCVVKEDFYDRMNDSIDFMEQEGTRWKPSIHMPKNAARIWLEITNVKVERLQDITEEGAIAEGVEEIHPAPFVIRWKDYIAEPNLLDSPYWSFYSLWCKINGAQSWKYNPWVWVVEFKRIERP